MASHRWSLIMPRKPLRDCCQRTSRPSSESTHYASCVSALNHRLRAWRTHLKPSSKAMNPDALFQALSTFAGRCAGTSDSRVHQNAAKQLQADLKRIKFEGDSSSTDV